jgi:hypothetical protein
MGQPRWGARIEHARCRARRISDGTGAADAVVAWSVRQRPTVLETQLML